MQCGRARIRSNRDASPNDINPSENSVEPSTVLEQLTTVLKPGRAHAWLLTPNPLLDHHPPIDLLREGESRQVIGAIDVLAEDVFV